MARIKGTTIREGDVVDANQLNEVFTAVEGMEIDDENTANNWAGQDNFLTNVSGYKPINETYNLTNTNGPWSTSSDSWSDVSTTYIDMNSAATIGENVLLRVSWDALMADQTLTSDTGASNLYAFRIKVTRSNGTSHYIAPGVYSFNIRSLNTTQGQLTPAAINWRSCAGSETIVLDGNSGYNRIYLQFKVNDTSNTMKVSRFNITAVLARR